jgi:hypothetical protein
MDSAAAVDDATQYWIDGDHLEALFQGLDVDRQFECEVLEGASV